MHRNTETRSGQPHADADPQNKSRSDKTTEDTETSQTGLINAMSSDDFTAWYREREVARNIKQGQSYFNGPSSIRPPERHSPSRFLECHRKAYYAENNAPKESKPPRGIFYFGSRFEEDIIVPFLDDASGDQAYVTNSLWVDFTEESTVGTLRIKGETDPVIVTRQNDPLLLTEIKTKQSVDNVTEPSDRHRAQAHAYMRGLTRSKHHEGEVTSTVIIYGSRTNLDISVFRVKFDEKFWNERVLQWAATQTQFQERDELPPATPENDWECKYCSYRERCGKGGRLFEDEPPTGLLPGVTDYPREHLENYLEAHRNVKLTPSLAHLHPDLADEFGVYDWECSTCGATQTWDDPNWSPERESAPRCQKCANQGETRFLSATPPTDQPVKRGQSDE